MDKKDIDWSNLGFGYHKTDKRFVSNFKDGAWDEGGLTTDDTVTISECAGVLQYAQTCFEGMKAYTTEQGKIVVFRPDLNGARMEDSCRRLEMPVFPKERFVEAVKETVKANAAYVPPFGSGATLYIRPYMFGSNAVIGVKPADEYQLVGEPQLSAQQVRIYGRKAALDTIKAIHTELLGLTDLKDTTTVRLALIVPRGVRLGADSVVLTIVTERYTEKAFVVPITVQDVPEGEFVRLFPQTTEVTVRVGMSHFGEVEANDVMAQCHYPENGAETLGVEVRYTNPYILSARAYPNEVEFIVER